MQASILLAVLRAWQPADMTIMLMSLRSVNYLIKKILFSPLGKLAEGLSILLGLISSFFTARRLAKRGICRRRVCVCLSVCLCVCHTPVLYQNGLRSNLLSTDARCLVIILGGQCNMVDLM